MKKLNTGKLRLNTPYGGNTKCDLWATTYHEGKALALLLVDPDGQPLATITCNIPHVLSKVDEILVKDWSENEGMVEWLERNCIAQRTSKTVASGFVEAKVMRLVEDIFLQIFPEE